MKRSGFKPKARPARQPVPAARLTCVPNYAMCTVSAPVEKENPARSEAYRRLVAGLDCIHCGHPGPSQHAHGNTGKGMGIKTDDRYAFPLCADRPGERGCHSLFDQGALFHKQVRRDVELEWARRTLLAIVAEGLYPKGLDLPGWAES